MFEEQFGKMIKEAEHFADEDETAKERVDGKNASMSISTCALCLRGIRRQQGAQ